MERATVTARIFSLKRTYLECVTKNSNAPVMVHSFLALVSSHNMWLIREGEQEFTASDSVTEDIIKPATKHCNPISCY
ncbi:hypothetical protein Tco_0949640 [Tanacetum coccineum]